MSTINEMKLAMVLEQIAYSVKSCRAGDGDTRSWQKAAEDCESIAEQALSELTWMFGRRDMEE